MSLPIDGVLDLQSVNKIINSAAPTSGGDLVNKTYADALAQGAIFIQAVRAASTGANVSLTAPGATLDTVTLSNGDRILLKDQTTASQDGIWVFNGASSTLTRPTDFKAGGTALPGTTVYVEQGSANIGALFTLIATANVTIDTTSEVWSQTNGTADITVTAPLTKTGNTIALTNPLPIANGGTNATTAAGARTSLGTIGRYAATIGDGTSTSIAVTHNLGSTDVQVAVYDMATGNYEIVPFVINSNNQITMTFGTAPATGSGAIGSGTGKRVVVLG